MTADKTTKQKPIQKAYQIDFSRIDEGYVYSQVFTVADTRNQARAKLFKESDGMLLYNGKEITFYNLPVIRCPNEDLYEFEGQNIPREKMDYLLKERKRLSKLQEILDDKSVVYVFIFKRGYYYGNNWCGYTDAQHRAGVYDKSEAVSHARGCEELTVIPIDIDNYNKMLSKEIENLELKKENIDIEIKNLQLKYL